MIYVKHDRIFLFFSLYNKLICYYFFFVETFLILGYFHKCQTHKKELRIMITTPYCRTLNDLALLTHNTKRKCEKCMRVLKYDKSPWKGYSLIYPKCKEKSFFFLIFVFVSEMGMNFKMHEFYQK